MGDKVHLNFSGFLSVLASLLVLLLLGCTLGLILGCLDCFIVLELIVNFPVFIIKFFFFLKNIFYEFSGFYIKETGKKKC